MRAESEISSGVNATAATDTSADQHGGTEIGIDTDVFDIALKAATPFDWDKNIGNAYQVGIAPSVDLASAGVPIKISNMTWISLGYNSYRYYPFYGDTDGKPWDEVGIGSRIELDLLSVMGLTEEFNKWKPAVDFDIVFPTVGDPAVSTWKSPRWELGFDSDFRLAWNADADTDAEDGSRIRFEASYSDHSKLSDLDFKLTLTEDDKNGYIDPNLEYNASALLSDVLGVGEDFGAPYKHTMGLQFDANIEYKFYLDEEETMWIEPFGEIEYDFGVLDQSEDSVFSLTFDVTASFFPNTEFQLKYKAPQLLKSQEGYTITADGDSWTATLADLDAQDVGDITFYAKVSY
jgi:hypothetical protein